MKRVLFDTNVILDIILERLPYYDDAAKLFMLIDERVIAGCVTASSITDIYYVTKKAKGHAIALALITDIIDILDVIGISRRVIVDALRSSMKDFEDAVQVSAATFAEIEYIVTRNTRDFDSALLPVYDPANFIEMIRE